MKHALGRREFLVGATVGTLFGSIGTATADQSEGVTTRVTGNSHRDWYNAVTQTPDGQLLLTGGRETQSPGEDGPTWVSKGWVQKRRLDGSVAWSETYASPMLRERHGGVVWDTEDQFRFSLPAGDGGFLHAGGFFEGGPASMTPWIAKTDGSGAKLWERGEIRSPVGSFTDDFSDGVRTDDGYLLVGRAIGGVAGDERVGDGWVVSLSATGATRWQRLYNRRGERYDEWSDDPEHDEFRAVVETGDGNYLLAGESGGTRNSPSVGWVLVVDASGRPVWERTYDNGGNDLTFTDVSPVSGGYVLTGITEASASGGPLGHVCRINAGGGLEWEHAVDYRCQAVVGSDGGELLVAGGTRDGFVLERFGANGARPGSRVDGGVPRSELFDGVSVDGQTVLAGHGEPSGTRNGLLVSTGDGGETGNGDGTDDDETDDDGGTDDVNALTVTKEGAADGVASFYVVAPGGVTPAGQADGVATSTAALDWLGPVRGTDAYDVAASPETFLLKGAATVRWNGTTVTPGSLGADKPPVDESALPRSLRVESTGTGLGHFAVTTTEGLAPTDTAEAVSDGYAAIDNVGPERGVDEFRFAGEISRFLSNEHVRVLVDGEQVDPGAL